MTAQSKKNLGMGMLAAGALTCLLLIAGTANRGVLVMKSEIPGAGDYTVRFGMYSSKTINDGGGTKVTTVDKNECADIDTDTACGKARKSKCGFMKFSGATCCLLSVFGLACGALLTVSALGPKSDKMLAVASLGVYSVLALFCLVSFSVMASLTKENDGSDESSGCGMCSPGVDKCGMGFTGGAYIVGWLLSMGLAALSLLFSAQSEGSGAGSAGGGAAGGDAQTPSQKKYAASHPEETGP